MRLRNDPKAQEILNQNFDLYINEPLKYKSKWNNLFNNKNSIYLEVGSGKGDFIINNALKYQNINFIALEKNKVICSKIIKKYNQLDFKLTNLKILNIDAKILNDVFDKKEVQKIYLNFSDPWPKKRHYKNRLTHDNFLKIFYDILDDNGLVEMKTDNDDLFLWSIENIKNNNNWKIIYYTDNLYQNLDNEFNNQNIQTEYEKRFVNLNKNINKLIFKKNI